MKRFLGIGAGILLLALVVVAPAFAIPKIMSWTADSGGTELWHETKDVGVTGGLFNVKLGAGETRIPLSRPHRKHPTGFCFSGLWAAGTP